MSNETKKIDIEVECSECEGTGVYAGMCERGGAAVVCCKCKGSGKARHIFTYKEFTRQKRADGVSRVYKSSYGFVIGTGVIDFSNAGAIDMDKEGLPPSFSVV